MFSYYAKWIPKFSEKIRPLSSLKIFSLDTKAILAFKTLKEEIAKSSMNAVDASILFTGSVQEKRSITIKNKS
jgi:hypothetical protein